MTMDRTQSSTAFREARAWGRRATVLVAAWVALPACATRATTGGAPPPVVLVSSVETKDVPITAEWVGTTVGLVNATIRAQVTGYLVRQHYQEGDFVRKGQLLFEIDPRTFRAALDQQRAQLTLEQARWTTAQADLRRTRPLAEENAVSQRELDTAVGNEQGAHAQVIAAQAAVERAQLDLGFTSIASPIDGIAGTAQAQIGDLVGPGSVAELTTVSAVDPIRTYFPVSEQEYLRWRQTHPTDEDSPPLEMFLSTGERYPFTGRLSYVDRAVNERTGTLRIVALFPNPGNVLRPGLFARIRAVVLVRKGALLVPQRAVAEIQGIPQIAVIGADHRAEIRIVKLGERSGSLWVVLEGVRAGEQVVVEGFEKVHQGAPVEPHPAAPETERGS